MSSNGPAKLDSANKDLGDVRIKIRKNSIEPTQMIKASHKQMFQKTTDSERFPTAIDNVIFEENDGDDLNNRGILDGGNTPVSG